jgi:hypothetical protein
VSKRDTYTPSASGVSFDNETNGFISEDTQAAIEEVFELSQNSSKGFVLYGYNGNANNGRYLEFFEGISSDVAPLEITDNPLEILTIVSRTVGVNATCTIGYYDIQAGLPGVLLHTTTFSANKEVIETGSPIFTLPAGGHLAVVIDSGSIQKPHIYFVGRGG